MAKPMKKRAGRTAPKPSGKSSRAFKHVPAKKPASSRTSSISKPAIQTPSHIAAAADVSLKLPMRGTAPTNMCSGCDMGCCNLRIDLSPFDVARIAHQENKNPKEFVEVVRAAADDSFGVRTKGGLVKMSLKKENGTCMFKRDGDLKCGIEKSKPAVCLVYPFYVSNGIQYLRDDSLCPLENRRRADYSKMSKKAIDDCVWEAQRYEEIVRLWNEHARGTEDYSRFLSFAVDDIESEKAPLGNLRRGLGRLMLRAGLR